MNSEEYLVIRELLFSIKGAYIELFDLVAEIHAISNCQNQSSLAEDTKLVERNLAKIDALYQIIQEGSAEVSALLSKIVLS